MTFDIEHVLEPSQVAAPPQEKRFLHTLLYYLYLSSVITEKSYRIPAVHKLLLAAAPFLMCVIFLFLFEDVGEVQKQRPALSSNIAIQDHLHRLDATQLGGDATPVDCEPSIAELIDLSLPAEKYVDSKNRDVGDFAQLDLGYHHESLTQVPTGIESLGFTPFNLRGSFYDANFGAPFESSQKSIPVVRLEGEAAVPDATIEMAGMGTSASTSPDGLLLPDLDRGMRPLAFAEGDATFQQKADLLREAGIAYAHAPAYEDSFIQQVQATSSDNVNAAAGGDESAGDPEEFGMPPPRRIPLFLQETTVLLEVGEYQYESGLRYSTNANVFPVSAILDGTAFVANATRKQQSVITPLEFRVGVGDELQAFVSLPLGWSKQRTTAQQTQQDEDNKLGIGDLSFGLTKLLWNWKTEQTRLLGSVTVSAPTGPSAFAINAQSDFASLGRGYWTAGAGVNVVHTIDPLAVFGGFGYTQTFAIDTDGGRTLNAGNTLYYSIGLGYAVNPTVSLNTAFSGGYTGEVTLNDQRLAGTATEPLSLKVAATFANASRDDKKKKKPHHKYLSATIREPFVRFGLTGSATDVDFGIRVTY